MQSKRFGEHAIPIAAMWELGGSVWAGNVYYAIASHVFRIAEAQDEEKSMLVKPTLARAPSFGTALYLADKACTGVVVDSMGKVPEPTSADEDKSGPPPVFGSEHSASPPVDLDELVA